MLAKSSGHRRGKPTSLRSMPTLCGFFPMFQDFEIRNSNQLTLDMSHVQRVDAVGLTIFASNLLHAIGERELRDVKLHYPTDKRTTHQMHNLAVPAILGRNGLLDPQSDLWANRDFGTDESIKGTAQCLIEIRNIGATGRDRQLHVARSQLKTFFAQNGGWFVNQSQIILMLMEMIKNTLDHTNHNALLGITINFNGDNPTCLEFAYCEQGPGLSQILREALRDIFPSRAKKASFADLIHWALRAGNSTKRGNGVNHGIGLTMITQGARSLGMALSMIDAQSMVSLAHLPTEPAHTTVRSAISKVARQGCFTYVGSKSYD